LDISEALEDEGYDVIADADNAIEALEARNDIHTVFNGLKLAAAVRELTRQRPSPPFRPLNNRRRTAMRDCHGDGIICGQALLCNRGLDLLS
jgi:hypothetical protein